MIKKYFGDDDTMYIVGQTADIKSVYKSMTRHNDYFCPLYTEFPKFSPYKRVYGISVDEDGWFHIINSDLISDLIINGLIKEF